MNSDREWLAILESAVVITRDCRTAIEGRVYLLGIRVRQLKGF